MSRLAPIAALAAATFVLPLAAQQRLDPSRMYPITSPIRHAGTVDVTTGRWTRAGQQAKGFVNDLFNNTCTWTTQAYFAGFDWCEENYDEGRIPSDDPAGNPPAGAKDNNSITEIEVSYCTFAGPLAQTGGYDMDLAFWDKLGGDCVGGVPPTPPAVSSTATAYIPLAGLGLPGSTAVGFQACWLVTLDLSNSGMLLKGDGDGTFDGNGADDKFIWMQRQNTTVGALHLPGTPDGFLISGEPATGGFGACTYNIPCGVDAISGLTCGTGLDSFDASWINVDGIGVGASGIPAGCSNSIAQYGFGTNCYFFGGYPTGPFASYWLVLRGDFICSCVGVLSFCVQTKPTSVPGCFATLTATNTTLATGAWSATNIPSASSATVVGIFIYTDGVGIGQSSVDINVPFGRLCIAGFKRSAPTCAPAVISAAVGCNAVPMTTAVNCNGGALGITVGEDVNVQFWHRDPAAAGTANFSNAIFYTVQ
jgi:hypothetical protein